MLTGEEKRKLADWSSEQYLKFERERTQPAKDLCHRIERDAPQKVLDVGCGPGNSTRILRERYPRAEILGIDSSPNMIEAARAACPGAVFQLCDAGRELDTLEGEFDVIFSNACIQWIPDHPSLLRGLMGKLRAGGVLAVQTPMNIKEPIHKIIGEIVRSDRWRDRLPNPRIFYNLTQEEYFDLLSELSGEFSLWQTTYCHRMSSHSDIIEWYRGTGLRPYLNALSKEEGTAFEQEVYERVVEAYPKRQNGEILFRFPRFFFTAVKKKEF